MVYDSKDILSSITEILCKIWDSVLIYFLLKLEFGNQQQNNEHYLPNSIKLLIFYVIVISYRNKFIPNVRKNKWQ